MLLVLLLLVLLVLLLLLLMVLVLLLVLLLLDHLHFLDGENEERAGGGRDGVFFGNVPL